jgi:four helix bundle protein
MDLVVEIYRITSKYPKSELLGLISQSRRCSVSIPCNIAEGRTRGSKKDFRQFLIIAMSSGAELETQIEIAKRLKFVNVDEFKIADGLLLEVMKMLNVMIKKLA